MSQQSPNPHNAVWLVGVEGFVGREDGHRCAGRVSLETDGGEEAVEWVTVDWRELEELVGRGAVVGMMLISDGPAADRVGAGL